MYLNIFYEKPPENSYTGHLHIWDSKVGYKKIKYSKYAYKLCEGGEYTTLYNQPCKLVRKWSKEDLNQGIIFESDINPEMRYLVDTYMNSDSPPENHLVMTIDIEVSTNGGLPDIKAANNEITAISYHNSKTNEYTVFILDPLMNIQDATVKQRDDTVTIKSYMSEPELLEGFLQEYSKIKPTILTGWNIDYFDIPYLYNRLTTVFDSSAANILSPVGIVEYNNYRERYFIAGVSCLDLMKLYKTFTFNERQSYGLDAIAKIEVGEGKIKYDGTLEKLYQEDKDKFIEYNVHDARLVKLIDNKMKLIQLALGICHKGHVPLEDVYFSSRYLDGAILTFLKRKGNVVAPNRPNSDESFNTDIKFTGAYVKDPAIGIHEWVVDLDVTSMYPSIIMSLNISPETKVVKLNNWNNQEFNNTDKVYSINLNKESYDFNLTEFKNMMETENLGISSNGVIYSMGKKGIIPEILEVWFDERTEMKKMVNKYGKERNFDGTINMNYNIEKMEYYDARQKIQKVLLNSLYGVLGLPSFRYYDLDNAEAVTTTGVDLIKFAQKVTNHYYEKLTGNSDDNILYTDTDSIFFSVKNLIPIKYPEVDINDDDAMVDVIIKISKDIQNFVNKSMDYFAKKFLLINSHRFNLKQEIVAKSAFWTAKKRYALWAINIEGRPVNKMDIKGLDVVRTSFPNVFRDFMTNLLWDILKKSPKEQIDSNILKLKSNIETVHFIDIARPTGVKEISKFCDNTHQPFTFKLKGTPVHVKAAINYNDFLRYFKLDNKYSHIVDNSKIKWVYLKENNPFKIEELAFKDNDEDPIEILQYIEKYIDRVKIFNSEMNGKLQDFYDALNWGIIPTSSNYLYNSSNFF